MRDFFGKRKNYWIIIGVAAVLTMFFCIFPTYHTNKKASLTGQYVPAKVMTSGETYSQEFVSQLADFKEILIPLATYKKVNTSGSIRIELKDDSGLVAAEDIQLKDVVDGQFYRFKFDEIHDSMGKTYVFSIYYTDFNEGNSLCFYQGDDGSIYFLMIGRSPRPAVYYIWWFLLISSICVVMMSVTPGVSKKQRSKK